MKKEQLEIVFISPGWPLQKYANGIVTYIDTLYKALHGKARVSIVALDANSVATENNIYLAGNRKKNLLERIVTKVLHFVPKSVTTTFNYKYSRYLTTKKMDNVLLQLSDHPDIIEVEESFGLPISLKAVTSAKVITRIHGPWFIHGPIMNAASDKKYKIRVEAEGHGLAVSDGITAPCYDVLNKVRQYYDLPLENAVVIPNAVHPVAEHAQWQYSSQNQTILFVGRFDLHKGGDIALNVFNLIAASNNTVEFYFIGPDRGLTINDEAYNLQDYLAEFISDEDVRKRIHVTGQLDAATVQQYRSKATVTIVTSRYENFPLSLLEALSTGSPIIASRTGGIPEIIEDGFNGFLVGDGDVEMFSKIALELLEKPEQLNQISKNAIKDAHLKYSPDVVAAKTLDYYQTILD
ncbi:MAG: glycosyltransferase family 4 protein [Methylophaga sp.]|uniref:glycosyltransferase family 4 protein n=1 Tax=Methylophaga sp. TaxID=2024840 RepID=UPI000C112382|nr:glycosyltransferase family 4 protein [Methylophaga sp.]MBL1457686.1 glycosyltransferase family 4 protein [Methylophaga sp.]